MHSEGIRSDGQGVAWYDLTNNIQRFTMETHSLLISNGQIYTDVQAGNLSLGWKAVNGRCFDAATPYSNLQTTLNRAKFVNSTVENGQTFEYWSKKIPFFGEFVYKVLILNATSRQAVPVQTSGFFTVKKVDYHITTGYDNVKPQTSIPDKIFARPQFCVIPHICALAPVMPMDVWRLHHPGDYNLTNHNAADILGEAVFLCQVVLGNRVSSSNYLSLFSIVANHTWGVYTPCNKECVGGSLVLVGREASEGLKARGGQCADNENTGSWYSLTSQAECSQNAPNWNDCAWLFGSRTKTVSLDCLKTNGILEACQKDVDLPYTNAAKIMLNAMKFNQTSQGGCPAVD